MNISQAREIVEDMRERSALTEQESFMYIEALQLLISKTNNTLYMWELGGYYYEMRCFDLALKYYEMAAQLGEKRVYPGLGYIWYYGRTGKKDYEKAFHWFSLAAENGDIQSEYKLADMYKNGYGVEKNYEKYKEIIERLYPKVKNPRFVHEPLPEVAVRLAGIRKEEGKFDEAISLYQQAKFFLAQRIRYSPFFGNLNIMKWLIEDLYELVDFDKNSFDFFDLFYLLKSPNKVTFWYNNAKYNVESVEADGEIAVRFNGEWFRNSEDFFAKAALDGKLLTDVQFNFYEFGLE